VVVLPYCLKCGREIQAVGATGTGICPTCGFVNVSVTAIQGEPSQVKYCQYCGRELASDAKFCSYCGTSVTAPIPTPPAIQPPPIKVSHIKRNILIVGMLVLLIAIVIAGLSRPGPETGTKTTTPMFQMGGTVRIGQPFILKEGTEEIPVEITFTSAYHDYYEQDAKYKRLVLEIQAKNVGMKETEVFSTSRWEVTVDKGYIYDAKYCNLTSTSLLPEEMETGYVSFEILATTTPVEIRYYDSYWGNNPAFVLDLRGEGIHTKTAKEVERLSRWVGATLLTENTVTFYIQNEGPVDVTIVSYYIEEEGRTKVGPVPMNITIKAGGMETVKFTSPEPWVSGHSYTIILVTSRDNQFAFPYPR